MGVKTGGIVQTHNRINFVDEAESAEVCYSSLRLALRPYGQQRTE